MSCGSDVDSAGMNVRNSHRAAESKLTRRGRGNEAARPRNAFHVAFWRCGRSREQGADLDAADTRTGAPDVNRDLTRSGWVSSLEDGCREGRQAGTSGKEPSHSHGQDRGMAGSIAGSERQVYFRNSSTTGISTGGLVCGRLTTSVLPLSSPSCLPCQSSMPQRISEASLSSCAYSTRSTKALPSR